MLTPASPTQVLTGLCVSAGPAFSTCQYWAAGTATACGLEGVWCWQSWELWRGHISVLGLTDALRGRGSQWQLHRPRTGWITFYQLLSSNISVQCFHTNRNWSETELNKDNSKAVRQQRSTACPRQSPHPSYAAWGAPWHSWQDLTSSTSQSHLGCLCKDC